MRIGLYLYPIQIIILIFTRKSIFKDFNQIIYSIFIRINLVMILTFFKQYNTFKCNYIYRIGCQKRIGFKIRNQQFNRIIISNTIYISIPRNIEINVTTIKGSLNKFKYIFIFFTYRKSLSVRITYRNRPISIKES
jgi:hypothetical protein